jgi:hypothetical protein
LLFFLKILAEKTLSKVHFFGFEGSSLENNSDIEMIRNFLKTKSQNNSIFKEISKDLDYLLTINHHKELAKRQRKTYEFMISNLKDDEILIDLDYKQKVDFFKTLKQSSKNLFIEICSNLI